MAVLVIAVGLNISLAVETILKNSQMASISSVIRWVGREIHLGNRDLLQAEKGNETHFANDSIKINDRGAESSL